MKLNELQKETLHENFRAVDVDLAFDDEDEPTFYVDKVGKRKWPYSKVFAFDWKEEKKAARQRTKMKGEVLELADGSDSIILAYKKDAVKI